MRLTAACPADMIKDANSLAAVLAAGPADLHTYGMPSYRDGAGNLYAVASFEVSPEWVTAAQSPLERPAWDGDDPFEYRVNLAGAERAQDALVVWMRNPDTPPPQARHDALVVIGGIDGRAALRALGLEQVEV